MQPFPDRPGHAPGLLFSWSGPRFGAGTTPRLGIDAVIDALIDLALALCENPPKRPLLRGQWRQEPAVPPRWRVLNRPTMDLFQNHGTSVGLVLAGRVSLRLV